MGGEPNQCTLPPRLLNSRTWHPSPFDDGFVVMRPILAIPNGEVLQYSGPRMLTLRSYRSCN
jgi:hypothetical protein